METRTIGSFEVSVVGLGATTSACASAARRRRPSWTPRSTPASTSSTPPTFTAGPRARPTSARRWAPAGTRSCWPPSSASPYEGHEGGALGRLHPHRRRGQPHPARHRPHRPLPAAPARPEDPDRRDDRRAGRAGGRGQGPRVRLLQLHRGHARRGRGGDAGRQPRIRQRPEPLQHPLPGARGRRPGVVRRAPAWPSCPSSRWPAGCSAASTGPGQPLPEGSRLTAMGDGAKSQLSDERLAAVADLDELAEREDHSVLTWPSGGCCRVPPWPRSSPAPPGPSRSPPTWRRGLAPRCRRAGGRRHHRPPLPNRWPPARAGPLAGQGTASASGTRCTAPAPAPGGPAGCR